MNIREKLPNEMIFEIYSKCTIGTMRNLSHALLIPIPYTETFIKLAANRRKYNPRSLQNKIKSRAMIMDIQIMLEKSRKSQNISKETFYRGKTPYRYAMSFITTDRFYS